jgi:hypothetical protein
MKSRCPIWSASGGRDAEIHSAGNLPPVHTMF